MTNVVNMCETCEKIGAMTNIVYQSVAEGSDDENSAFEKYKANGVLGEVSKKNINALAGTSLGTLEELENRKHCPSCQAVFRAAIHSGRKLSLHTNLVFEVSYRGLNITTDESPFSTNAEMRLDLSLLPFHTSKSKFQLGRAFGKTIDIQLLRQWAKCCLSSHKNHCILSQLPLPSHQIYLIDVKEQRLVLKSPQSRYITLSYVWGKIKVATTTIKNLKQLEQPGSIGPDVQNLTIPNTIRDAMRLVLLLEERYLWVDSFCIVQDRHEAKQLNLQSMASIYSNSIFTVIAAEGEDANHGLSGVEGGSRTRSIPYDLLRFPSGPELLACQNNAWMSEYTTWASRAWTFQEALFSRRLLIFNKIVSWHCRVATWEEHVAKDTEDLVVAKTQNPHGKGTHLATNGPSFPDIHTWDELIREFNIRKLTYDGDAMDAFAGVTSVFNRRFSGGILWGLPEMFFDDCIVWKHPGVLKRRMASVTASENPFPSWSWIGWEGEIRLCGLGHGPSFELFPYITGYGYRILPVVKWFKKSSQSDSTLHPIKNTYLSLEKAFKEDKAAEVPPGWTRHLYQDRLPYFTHDEAPSVKFRCPVPLENSDEGHDSGRYLYFEAQRAWLLVGEKLVGKSDPVDWTSCPASLVDREGNWMGSIRLNVSRSDGPPTGHACELIALSIGLVMSDGDHYGLLDEWVLSNRPSNDGVYAFYNVMWIEWEGGVAYRKAVGTVYKKSWENLAIEIIPVKLG